MKGSVNVPGMQAPKCKWGTYTGTGEDVTIEFNFTPRILFIGGLASYEEGGLRVRIYVQTQMMYGQPNAIVRSFGGLNEQVVNVTWGDRAVTLALQSSFDDAISRPESTYSYFALGE